MRNYLLSLLVALLAVTGSLPAAAQEAYAVFTSDGETLTFYYDNLRDTRRHYGHTYNMPKPGERPAWVGNERYDQEYIKHAVFDASFSGYRPTSIRSWFEYCINLQDIEDIRNLNTEKVTDMSSMFKGCIALTSLDLSKFNTENVTDMSWMFGYCHALKSLDVSNFNTQNVTDMDYMFYNCSALTSLDVSKFNTQNVTDMSSMFSSCTSLATIFCNNNWKVRYKIYDSFMFNNCTKLKGTNTSFDASKTGIEMANPTTGYFTSKTVLAEAYAVLTPDGTLTFYYDNQRPNHQNYERIYDMPKFQERPTWAGDYNTQNIKHVVFDVSFSKYRPISTRSWFECCINLKDIEGIRNLNTENVTNMSWMFYSCEALTSLDVSNFNTQKVTDMGYMFAGCKALTSLDVSKFNTQNVTDMSWMFYGCRALKSLNVSNFNTQNVTDMSNMFHDCKALTSLDVSNFNTQNVTDMSWMFYGCTSLTTIFCNNNWKVRYKIYDLFMFNNCTKLKGTNTSFDASKTGIEMANPTTGYFTIKTTGIDNVKTADRAGDGKAYDLSGRRVNESYKGIVIKNGKKYIQK